MATRIRIKRGTESQITGYTGPHFEGELAYATNTGNVFVNDGTAFINIGGGGGATPTLQSVTDEGNTTTNNIGIGTSSPSYPLHVVGNSLVTGTQFIGDTFTRIQQGSGNLILSNSSSDGSVVLRTNSVEQMRLTSAGRVGIGTTNPISKLELQDGTFTVDNGNIDVFFGGISIDRNSANNTALKVNQRGTADIFALQDDGTDVLTVIDGGNVGIGTTSPADYYSNKLVVSAEDESGITLAATTNSAVNHIMFADGTTGSEAYRGYLSYNHLDDSMRIGVGSTERMRIGVNGAVAIGSTNTATGYALYVAGNVGVSGLATTGDITLGENRAIRNLGSTIIDIDSNNNGTADYFAVTKGGYVSSTTLLKVEQDGDVIVPIGNVGIGTSAPAQKLDVAGYVQSSQGYKFTGSTFGQFTISGGQTYVDYDGDFRFRALPSYNTSFIVTNSGKVGIGTTAPVEKVHINGNLRLGLAGSTGYYISWGQNEVGSTGDFARIQGVRTDALGNQAGHLIFQTKQSLSGTTPTERLRITDTGNVGIGTTAPAAKLDVNGSIYPTTHNAGTLGLIQFKEWSYVATRRITGENNRMELLLNGNVVVLKDHNTIGEGIQIKNRNNVVAQFGDATGSGNVGIGTTAPSYLLHLVGANAEATTTPTSNGQYAGFSTEYGGEHRMFAGYIGTAAQHGTSVATYFGSPAGYKVQIGRAGSTSITIDTSNRVGINTSTPAEALQVNGTVSADAYKIYNNSTALSTTGTSVLTLNAGGFGRVGINSGGSETISVTGGNVGIGTTAPDSKLHVKATSGIAFKVDPNSADKEWYIDTTNPDHLKKEGNLILNADPTNVHTSTKISFNIDGSNKASINSDGDLGVGTTAQTSKVHVDGTAMRQLRMGTSGGPSGNTDTSGAIGDMAYDDNYFYIKTINGWGRVPLDFGF